MGQTHVQQGYTYHIRIKEALERPPTDWFGGITITAQETDGTLLCGAFPDQPALRGFMDQLWNLNLTVLYLERIENEGTQ